MKQEYKYTSDGKKVIVVGKLNAQETIVQEIFVSNDVEVPSGENFVVKSLHDAPAVSWKEKQLRQLEKTYDAEKKRLEGLIQETNRKFIEIQKKSSLRASFLLGFAEKEHPDFVDRLSKFLSGSITHYAKIGYSPVIHSVEENACFNVDDGWGACRVDGIKLVSLFGLDDGSLEYRINQYCDGSGSWTKVIPCCSREEAVAVLQQQLDEEADKWSEGKSKQFPRVEAYREIEGIVIPKDLEDYLAQQEAVDLREKAKAAKINLDRINSRLKEAEDKITNTST